MLFTACDADDSNKTGSDDSSTIALNLNKGAQVSMQDLIQKILDLPKWQWVYHPEVNGRLPVRLLKNDLVTDSVKLIKFNQKVHVFSDGNVDTQKNGAYVEITKLKFASDTAHFEMRYPIEGAFASGQFIKVNGKWVVVKYTVGEY